MLKTRFDFIRYANCWEDADYLLSQLKPVKGEKIFSIASAGDNALALLSTEPELLVAADLSLVQLYLLELKILLFKELEYEEMVNFLCRKNSGQISAFRLLKKKLPIGAREFWEKNESFLPAGILNQGKFERYFSFFAKFVLPWIHSPKTIQELFNEKPVSEQRQFYMKVWNNRRWKLIFHLFFSRFVLGKFGRDPGFLEQVEVPVSQFLYERAVQHLSSKEVQGNYFLEFILTGKRSINLPFYLRKENFGTIKGNLETLVCEQGYAQEVAGKYGNFDSANLSNIFEYMSLPVFREFERAYYTALKPGAKTAYWNLMATREMSTTFPGRFYSYKLDLNLTDNCFFYRKFLLDIKK